MAFHQNLKDNYSKTYIRILVQGLAIIKIYNLTLSMKEKHKF